MTLDAAGAETGYCARRRGRTLGEVAEDLKRAFAELDSYADPLDAYVGGDGTVFFDARSFPGYGALSGNRLDELRPGATGTTTAPKTLEEHVKEVLRRTGVKALLTVHVGTKSVVVTSAVGV